MTILPEMFDCEAFINADEIARGLSPLNPDKAAMEAGRIMLRKIEELISKQQDFAFETTLATKSYSNTIKKAQRAGYRGTLVFFYLDSHALAIERVKARVIEGGHDIPKPVIIRRYDAGLKNLFKLYTPICDYWMLFDNSRPHLKLVAEGYADQQMTIRNKYNFDLIKAKAQDD